MIKINIILDDIEKLRYENLDDLIVLQKMIEIIIKQKSLNTFFEEIKKQ